MKFCNVLYFKHIIENSMNSFFSSHKNEFTYDKETGTLVFSSGMSKTRIKSEIRKRMVSEILGMISPYDPMNRIFFFLVGSCNPSDNYLLKHIDKNRYFPQKIMDFVKRGNVKYVLRQDGVRIDLTLFNSIFEEIFNEFFTRKGFVKYFPDNERNLFFIKSKNLDCYLIWRIIKRYFGRINVSNMYEENKAKMIKNLYSVNNQIDSYVCGIKDMLKNEDIIPSVREIEQYLDICIGRKELA